MDNTVNTQQIEWTNFLIPRLGKEIFPVEDLERLFHSLHFSQSFNNQGDYI